MGSKKLKAISVRGTGKVSIADPERMQALIKAVGEEGRSTRPLVKRIKQISERIAAETGCAFVVVAGDVFEHSQLDRRTVARALDALRPGDRFNVVEFNSHTRPLFPTEFD